MTAQRVRVRGGVVRITAWHGRHDVASIALRGRGAPEPASVTRLLERTRAAGYRELITNALTPVASLPFLDAGFVVRARLRVLVHDLSALPPPTRRTRRAKRDDRSGMLEADADAFDEFWRFDDRQYRDAVRATPSAHVRVAPARGAEEPPVSGYAIFGRAGTDGYLQRLAVRRAAAGAGLGRALVTDGLQWLRSHGAARVFVNTQVDNERATALYERTGFRAMPVGLCILGREL